MAILVDYNQVILASLFASIGNHTDVAADENIIRHMFLNSIRSNRKKFGAEYGEIVICADGKNTWRKAAYPYYKANRKAGRDKSGMDWPALFTIMSNIREEVAEIFPYKVIHMDHCEADDIIGAVIHDNGTELNMGAEKFLILSADKDFIQLQTYANVDQYDPIRKRWLRNDQPAAYLEEHILKGDTGDGVPNILSPDNCLAVGERQKAMTQKRLALYKQGTEVMDEETLRRFYRNKMMIDLTQIPQNYVDQILEKYNEEKTVGRQHLFNYFVTKKLKHLITDIQDF
jgi:5'-3' exonuclease|tara:strand:+ start:4598 stop:5458 length:861 start_codon:yes stop_codon:yes gene_type:complete